MFDVPKLLSRYKIFHEVKRTDKPIIPEMQWFLMNNPSWLRSTQIMFDFHHLGVTEFA